MDEPDYLRRVDALFGRLEDLFEDVDPDRAEAFRAGDVLTITFADRTRCVINTQRPTRQVWMAHGANAWHFGYDAEAQRWLDDRGRGLELVATLRSIVSERAGVELP